MYHAMQQDQLHFLTKTRSRDMALCGNIITRMSLDFSLNANASSREYTYTIAASASST